MTPRQEQFVAEYLVDLNATQAAIRAGYSAKWAASNIDKVLKNTEIQNAIQSSLSKRSEKTAVTADMVLRELARIAFADTRSLYREDGSMKLPHEMDDDTAAALAGVDTFEETSGGALAGYTRKVRRWEKTKALELLGKHLGMFPTGGRLELSLGGDASREGDREGRTIARRLILEEVRETRDDDED